MAHPSLHWLENEKRRIFYSSGTELDGQPSFVVGYAGRRLRAACPLAGRWREARLRGGGR